MTMKTAEHYLNILLSLPPNQPESTEVSVTIQTLSEALECSPRNVKLILRRLEEEGFIEWRAGVGRGKASRMTLLKGINEIADEYFHKLLVKDKIKEAMDYLYRRSLPRPLHNKLRVMLDKRFGLQVERTKNATLDVLRVTVNRRAAVLDPAFVSTSSEVFFLRQICDTLVSFDPVRNTYVPSLAHAWESDEEGRRWTFYLRKRVRFHHGRQLTTEDVLHTFQRLKDVRSPSRWQIEEVERIETVSDHVISFYLKEPNRLFLNFFGSFYMSVLPHDVPFAERAIVGTGPFRMAEFSNQVFVLEAYEDYFKEKAHLDRVEVWYTPEDRRNERYLLPDWEETFHEKSHGGKTAHPIAGCQVLVFNFRKHAGIHRYHSFRKSIRMLYDRLAIIRELKGNRIAPAEGFLPTPGEQFLDRETTLEEARASLAESGYSGETLKLYYLDREEFEDDARWLQLRGEAIGLRLSIQPIPLADYYSTDADREADVLLICEALEDDTEWGYLRMFQDEASFLRRFMDNEQRRRLDESLRRFVTLSSPEQRADLLEKIERRLRDEYWILFGYHQSKIVRYHPALHGVTLDSFGWIDFSKLWVKKAPIEEAKTDIK